VTVTLAVVCGPPGVGKSSAAATAAEHLDAALLRTDVVRKELFEEPGYGARETERTYAELLDRARDRLAAGEGAVLDGTFRRRGQRDRAAETAAQESARFRLLRVTCEPAVVRERIRARGDDPSDADVDVYESVRAAFEPVDREHATVDNSDGRADTRRQVLAALAD
jgi:hypothetical protein